MPPNIMCCSLLIFWPVTRLAIRHKANNTRKYPDENLMKSTMTRSSRAILVAAAAAALLFAVERSPSPKEGGAPPRRRLTLPGLRESADPKSIVWKAPPLITETDFFPFHHTYSKSCIDRETIVGVSRAVRGLLEQGIRVFPRNGFLLGIVRHGGFLPNEHVDLDLGVVSSDLEKLNLKASDGGLAARVPGFALVLKNFREGYWLAWKGINPASREPYPFMAATMHARDVGISLVANAVYPYMETGAFFFPWLTTTENHEARLADGLRYNAEGGDLRLVDTDERLDADNYNREGAQLGNVFDTDLTCFEEVQFYFTTIPVPCDYEKILTSLYGENWHHVENRGDIGATTELEAIRFSSHAVSEEDNEHLLRDGPRPICIPFWKPPPLITETEIFPYHSTTSDRCIERKTIVEVSLAVRALLEQGIRVFPRNGFLLGIVRHSGFLPNEHVDVDLGVVSSDLERLKLKSSQGGLRGLVPGFTLQLKNFGEGYWQNWKGIDPASGESYPFMTAMLHATELGLTLVANPVYPYRDTGLFFYPWLTRLGNHESRLADSLRYNTEGGDLRLIDTDERLDNSNYDRQGAQFGNVFNTNLTCFEEVQFYFTTIPVPCDYGEILTSLYGENWHHVENRGDIGAIEEFEETHFASNAVSDEKNEQLLRDGPRPICES